MWFQVLRVSNTWRMGRSTNSGERGSCDCLRAQVACEIGEMCAARALSGVAGLRVARGMLREDMLLDGIWENVDVVKLALRQVLPPSGYLHSRVLRPLPPSLSMGSSAEQLLDFPGENNKLNWDHFFFDNLPSSVSPNELDVTPTTELPQRSDDRLAAYTHDSDPRASVAAHPLHPQYQRIPLEVTFSPPQPTLFVPTPPRARSAVAPERGGACVTCHRQKVTCVRTSPSADGTPGRCERCIRMKRVCEERVVETGASSHSTANLSEREKNACVFCHKAKAACVRTSALPDGTPGQCERCIRMKRNCEERSPEEIAAAKARRYIRNTKRTRGPVAEEPFTAAVAQIASTLQPTVPGVSLPTSVLSQPRAPVDSTLFGWSSTYCAALERHRVRDTCVVLEQMLFKMQKNAAQGIYPAPTSLFVFAHAEAQLSQSLALLNDYMLPEHFIRFVSGSHLPGAIPCEPGGWFHNWIDPSTRPYFFHLPRSEADGAFVLAKRGDLTTPQDSEEDKAEPHAHAQFRCELQPASARTLVQKAMRTVGFTDAALSGRVTRANVGNSRQLLSDPAVRVFLQGVDWFQISEMSMSSCENPVLDAATLIVEEHEQQSKEQQQPQAQEGRSAASQFVPHASWCPTFAVSVAISQGTTTAAAAGLPTMKCNCSQASPLRLRVRINSSWERLFGYSQAELSALMVTERSAFQRRFFAPEEWSYTLDSSTGMIALACRNIQMFLAAMDLNASQYEPPSSSQPSAMKSQAARLVDAAEQRSSGETSSPLTCTVAPRRAYTRPTRAQTRWGVTVPCSLSKYVWAQALRFLFVYEWVVVHN